VGPSSGGTRRKDLLHLPPPLTSTPRWIQVPRDPVRAQALREEVKALISKEAIEIVRDPSTPGFYAHVFVVPKPDGRWRPIIDLSLLNTFISAPTFRMETTQNLKRSILPQEFAVSLDLADAYLHVPMHRSTRKFLRFALDGQVFAFRAMPFGLNLSPWIFTRLMDTVMADIRLHTSSEISSYLDDILQKHVDASVLTQDLQFLLQRLEELGFLINRLKSDLTPSQDFVHLGMHFRTDLALVKLPEKRVTKLLTAVQQMLAMTSTTPRHISKVIGLCAAAADLIPLGRLRVRPLQWALAKLWSPTSQDWDLTLPLSAELRHALLPWTLREWLERGVPLSPATATVSLCTDASQTGWGAHLLPEFITCSGRWTPEEQALHINELEMKAVRNALMLWKDRLRGQAIMLLSDNSTVVAYLRNQGGTHSFALYQLTMEILLLCDTAQIQLSVRHIPGRLNVLADGLSRGQALPTEWTLHKEVFLQVQSLYPGMQIDIFATRLNNRLQKFVSPVPDPLALAVDGLAVDWTGLDLYAYPPTPLLPKVLQRLNLFQCQMTLIAPLRWNRAWITPLLQRLVDPPRRLPLRPDLLLQPGCHSHHPDLEALNLHVFRLCGGPYVIKDSLRQLWTESLMKGAPLL
jgi:hypothetical protein